jgi:hypothetical protein
VTVKEAMEIVLYLAGRFQNGEGAELCGTKEQEAIEIAKQLTECILT